MLSRVGNVLAFQIGWFACVLGAANGHPWLGPLAVLLLLALHLWFAADRRAALRIVLTVGMIGAATDSTLGYLGILQFRDSLFVGWFCPPWLIALWVIFATTLQSSLSWLAARPLTAAVLGSLFGPVSYYAGQALGALNLTDNLPIAVTTLSAIWALLFPLLLWWAEQLAEKIPEGTH
jgi:Protein of unknown function (DUF2878)